MKNVAQVLLEYFPEFEQVAEATLEEAGKRGVELARVSAAGKFKAGSSFQAATVFTKLTPYSGLVLNQKEYSGYLEEGNNQKGPFIYPVRKKALHFFINGEEVFAKKVRAHGPYNFMGQAAEELEGELPAIFEAQFDKIVNRG